MKIDFNKLIKGILTFSLLLIAFTLFYYFVIFLPQKERIKIELQQQEQWERTYALDDCLTRVEEERARLFSLNIGNCNRASGFDFDCMTELSDNSDKWEKEKKEECFKRYPQK